MKKETIIGIIAAVIVFIIIAILSYNVFHRNELTTSTHTATSTEQVSTSTDNVPATTTALKPGYVNKVGVYYIAIEDAGKMGKKIGCNDSVVEVVRNITPTQSPLRAALESLLANHNQKVENDLYNSLYQSNLKLDSLALTNGVATIKLTGTMALGGVCDDPRFEAQIQETALQFPSVKTAEIYINGKPLVLGGKGE
jgi:spore germination protein GerM